MARVKKGKTKIKRRRSLLAAVKGYRHGRSKKKRQAQEAFLHAGRHGLRDRRRKKRDFRRLAEIRVNAAARHEGLSYSRLIGGLKKKGVILNRKILAELGKDEPETFTKIASLCR